MNGGIGRAGLGGVMLAVLVGCGGSAAGESDGSARTGARTQTTEAARLSSAVLQSRWWTWAASEPEATNPVADEDGRACGRNQPKDVWFLAGTFGTQAERTCTVPGGVPLAFPLVNLVADPADCAEFMSTAEGSAVLDGEKIDAETSRGETISVEGVAGNPVTGTGERFTATGCGLWVQLPPLRSGKHTLEIRGRSQDFSVGVDYTLTVESA
ncbi:signal protein [Streptomyces sp. WM6386]|uniref:signal protein n=1 Tax=Streptomyces sp. WM6386 TaxID=1415558 RepID=UPI000A4D9CE5|nr:signal protein [Streptomyces sp. WM6386]